MVICGCSSTHWDCHWRYEGGKERIKLSKLLLDDKPLIILPSLAERIGLNESIVLQQIHYWLLESKNIKDGEKWVYNTYEDWQKQFPFWSISTIRRIIGKLEKENLVLVGNFNKLKIDNTKWYRINRIKLDEQTTCSNWTDEKFKMNRPLPEITTENKKNYIQLADTVRLTQDEYNRLIEDFGKATVDTYIEKLDEWQTNNPRKKKKDHNKTLRVWMKDVKNIKNQIPNHVDNKPKLFDPNSLLED